VFARVSAAVVSVSAVVAASRESQGSDWRLPTPGGSHPHVAEIQRARLLSATIRAVDELGYSNTSVADITGRARVSRRTFYELFADREACVREALRDVVELIERDLTDAGLDKLSWRERVRAGLWLILSFFDREPAIARVCVVQALRGGPRILEAREELLGRLASVVNQGRLESDRAAEQSFLTAEGLVGAAFAILYTRLLRGDKEPLTSLLGELTGLIVLPYLGPATARREQTRLAPEPVRSNKTSPGSEQLMGDPLAGIPIRLTYRTTRVLECVAAESGASNRQVADHAGISDQGQVSKLLSRLERVGLLQNAGKERQKGEANAWRLTDLGESVSRHLHLNIQQLQDTNTTKETR
jgi:AcrR family transcriptional regulator/DNA-binding MarR family transcriptional regulator